MMALNEIITQKIQKTRSKNITPYKDNDFFAY